MSSNHLEKLAISSHQLGQILRGFRKEIGLTQEQIGQRAGFPQKEISKMETGLGKTSVDRLFALLSALELELVIRPRNTETQIEGEW